jgi:hypothetical protein
MRTFALLLLPAWLACTAPAAPGPRIHFDRTAETAAADLPFSGSSVPEKSAVTSAADWVISADETTS